ncbi:MAG: type II toxin-antitoxin system VapC family toxin [Deltaproteobacteria bacterium]|nr:MAG: type II toxin-antitoxin system VapC family toxin [Deltaproteobacteria bacterium]
MILLDTHVLVHYANSDRKLGKRARSEIDHALGHDELFVSALTFWEIAMLIAKQRLHLETTVAGFRAAALRQGIQEGSRNHPDDRRRCPAAVADARLPHARCDGVATTDPPAIGSLVRTGWSSSRRRPRAAGAGSWCARRPGEPPARSGRGRRRSPRRRGRCRRRSCRCCRASAHRC